jgi:hypothetical protein
MLQFNHSSLSLFQELITSFLDPVGSAFSLGLDPDPYSESGSIFWIQVSKNRFKKLKFTITDLNDANRKMLRLS